MPTWRPQRRLLCWMVLAAPAAQLGWDASQGALGSNPVERLVCGPGYWALAWLLVALAIAPLCQLLPRMAQRRRWHYGKRTADWHWLLQLRRPAGLGAFCYALLHLLLYLLVDLDWDQLAGDLLGKPYIEAALSSLVLLLPLALTAPAGWIRPLRRLWQRLHLLLYPASALMVLLVQLSRHGLP